MRTIHCLLVILLHKLYNGDFEGYPIAMRIIVDLDKQSSLGGGKTSKTW